MEKLGIALIGTAIIWVVMIIGSTFILRGTLYLKKAFWLLTAGAAATWLFLIILSVIS